MAAAAAEATPPSRGWLSPSLFGSDENRLAVLTNTRATVALYGSIILWVGIWDMLTMQRHRMKGEHSAHEPHAHGITAAEFYDKFSLRQNLWYILGGAFGQLVTDTYYQTAGLGGSYTPAWFGTTFWLYIRATVSLPASIVLWTGVYDLMSYLVLDDALWGDMTLICTGIFILDITGTMSGFAFIWVDAPNDEEAPEPTVSSGALFHAVHMIRVTVSLFAQNAIWLGVYDLMENYRPSTLERELLYCCFGVLLMIASSSYVANSWIVTEHDETNGSENPPSAWINLRSLMSIAGQCINNTGFWTILDLHLWKSSLERNVCYTAVGFGMLLVSGAWFVQTGVEECDEEDEDAEMLEPLMSNETSSEREVYDLPMVKG